MDRRTAVLSALGLPFLAASAAHARPGPDLQPPPAKWDLRTSRPGLINIFGRRDGDDLVVEATGENGSGGFRTLLRRRTAGASHNEPTFELVNRPPRGNATAAITPFYVSTRIPGYFADPKTVLYAGGFVTVRVAVRQDIIRAYVFAGQP